MTWSWVQFPKGTYLFKLIVGEDLGDNFLGIGTTYRLLKPSFLNTVRVVRVQFSVLSRFMDRHCLVSLEIYLPIGTA